MIDLHRAIYQLWLANGLDSAFTDYWESGVGEFLAYNEMEAAPGTPMPYVIYEAEKGSVSARMSGHSSNEKHEFRDVSWTFMVHARQMGEDSGKDIAHSLAQSIMAVFGGHPTVVPQLPVLETGKMLQVQYQSDWGMRTGDKEYSWNIQYAMRIDVPVAV